MSKLQKPDFSIGQGHWVDPAYLPESVKDELRLRLKKSPLNAEQQESLIAFSNDMAQELNYDIESYAAQRKEIEAVAANAYRLLTSLRLLGRPAKEALTAHADYLAFGTQPPVDLADVVKQSVRSPEGNLLSSAWDWVSSLQTASEYASQQFNIDRSSKPELFRARGHFSMTAQHIKAISGKAPPADPASWFAEYCQFLGERLSLDAGPRIVDFAAKSAR